jgi:hypothetical protein
MPQKVEGLREITDPDDQLPGTLRKVSPKERCDTSQTNASNADVADSGGGAFAPEF